MSTAIQPMQMTDKERLIELLNTKVEDRGIALKEAYADFGRSVLGEDSESVKRVANKCRILEGEQNAFEECIDLIQTELR